jgi:hypothetical protein
MSQITYTTTATATYATGNAVAVASTVNMFPGLPIVFTGNVFGNITAGTTYYIGSIAVGYPTSNITLSTLPGGSTYGVIDGTGTMTATFNQGGQQIVPTVAPGEPINQAFTAVNVNFDQIFAAGPVDSNIQITDNSILSTNTNGNINLVPNGIGNVVSSGHVLPNSTRIRNLGSPNLRWNTVYSQYLDATSANIGSFGNLTVDVGNLHISGGTNGYVLQTDGAGNLTWTAQTGGSGNGTPGGANTQVQFNDANSFGGSAGFTFDKSSNALAVPGDINLTDGTVIQSSGGIEFPSSSSEWDLHSSDGNIYIGALPNEVAYIDTYSPNISVRLRTLGNPDEGPGYDWIFDPTGRLTTPGEVWVQSGDSYNSIVFTPNGTDNNGQIKVDGGQNMIVSSNNNFYVKRVGQDRLAVTDTTTSLMAATNVQIQSNRAGSADTWVFGSDGTLTFPDAGIIDDNGGIFRVKSNANAVQLGSSDDQNYVTVSTGNVTVQTLADTDNYNWTFDTTGNLTLPGGGTVSDTGADGIGLTVATPPVSITLSGADHAPCNGTYTQVVGYQQSGLPTWFKSGDHTSQQYIVYNSGSNQWQAVTTDINTNPIYINTGSEYLPLAQWAAGYSGGPYPTGAYTYSNPAWTFDPTGNLTLPSDTANINYANGVSILDGITGNYGDSNVVTLMADFGSNVISTTGNVSAGNVLTSAMVIANGEIQSGTGFFTGGYLSVNGNTDLANANITGSLSAVGNVTAAGFTTTGATGNITGANYITANYFVGDGGLLSNVGALIQSNVAPSDPTSSTMWWDTTDGSLYVWYTDNAGSQWVAASPTGVDWANVTSNIIPSANNVFSLGNATNQWASVYVGANTLYLNNVPVGINGNILTVNGANVVTAEPGGAVSTTGNIVGGNFYYGNGTPVAGSGPQGATGPAGVNGATGPTGANGTNGATGATGANGTNGATGATGPAGSNGATGATGAFTGNLTANINGQGYSISNVATISATGNVTAQNFIGNISITGNVTGTSPNVSLVAGSYTYTFDNTGNVTLPAGGDLVFSANTTMTSLSNGNITIDPNGTGQLLVTATTPAQFGNTISATGNITTSGKFIGDGSALANVATKSSGSWTLATGTNTVNFTVTAGRTYSMWVSGNIPNGIVVWNATATLTNTNVPVIGQQFGWYYSAGNALVLTSMPSQIIGTAGSISTASPAVANTNVFNFTIVNNSGSSQTVYYGWTQIS